MCNLRAEFDHVKQALAENSDESAFRRFEAAVKWLRDVAHDDVLGALETWCSERWDVAMSADKTYTQALEELEEWINGEWRTQGD